MITSFFDRVGFRGSKAINGVRLLASHGTEALNIGDDANVNLIKSSRRTGDLSMVVFPRRIAALRLIIS